MATRRASSRSLSSQDSTGTEDEANNVRHAGTNGVGERAGQISRESSGSGNRRKMARLDTPVASPKAATEGPTQVAGQRRSPAAPPSKAGSSGTSSPQAQSARDGPRFPSTTAAASSSSSSSALVTSQGMAAPVPGPSSQVPRRRSHVDIATFPSAELLRLLAIFLEQIAHANDRLNEQRASASSSPGADDAATSAEMEESSSIVGRDRFDAAPLNSPIAERSSPAYGGRPSTSKAPSSRTSPLTRSPTGEAQDADMEDETGKTAGVNGGTPGPKFKAQSVVTTGVDSLTAANAYRSNPGSQATSESGGSGSGSGASSRRASLVGGSSSGGGKTKRTTGFQTPSAPSSRRGSTTQLAMSDYQAREAAKAELSFLTASKSALSSPSATLCFHARNVPQITIEAYLQRILKYCPTTNEVFLSLLVYFDRMARVGISAAKAEYDAADGTGSNLNGKYPLSERDASGSVRVFAIDSYNIHRLVIAGVTVASKFFSDVFYTNSRYAKVGGLPLHELNQLELQFLLLNDFRLVIPLEELQRYADLLVPQPASPPPEPAPSLPAIQPQVFAVAQPIAEAGSAAVAPQTPTVPSADTGAPTLGTISRQFRGDDAMAISETPPADGSGFVRPGGMGSTPTSATGMGAPRMHTRQSSTSTSSSVVNSAYGTPSSPQRPHSIRSTANSTYSSGTSSASASTLTPGSSMHGTPRPSEAGSLRSDDESSAADETDEDQDEYTFNGGADVRMEVET